MVFFETVNLLNLKLQDRRSYLVTCAQAIRGNVNLFVKTFIYKIFSSFQNVITTVSISECIAACIDHPDGFHVDIETRHNDLIKMDYPL